MKVACGASVNNIVKWAKDLGTELRSCPVPKGTTHDKDLCIYPHSQAMFIDNVLLPKLKEIFHSRKKTRPDVQKYLIAIHMNMREDSKTLSGNKLSVANDIIKKDTDAKIENIGYLDQIRVTTHLIESEILSISHVFQIINVSEQRGVSNG